MARWILPLIISLTLLEVKTNFEPEENHCEYSVDSQNRQQMDCGNASVRYFENFKLPLNRTQRLICNECFLNTIDEHTFNFPPRHRVNVVALHNSRIRSLRRFAFRSFPLLKVLNLWNNSIDVLDVDSFSSLKRLLQLDLSRNEIQILPANLFHELENLDILNLNSNKIFSTNPESFQGLSRLKYLYMNHNNLKRLEENMFFPLKDLKILYLEHNMILEIHQNAFRNLKSLQFLYINHNSIMYLVPYNFKPLFNLVHLQMRYNNLSEIQTSTFNGLSNLRTLHLGKNELVHIKPYGLVGVDQLEILDLAHNKLESINYFTDFSHLQNLLYLWLQYNSIKTIDFNFKYEVPNSLAVLDLSNNQIVSFKIQLFRTNLPKVLDLFVANNSWNCQFIINLYGYLSQRNVSVCYSRNCSSNVTERYIEDICNSQMAPEEVDDSVESDFTTDSSRTYYISPVILTFIVIKCIYLR